MFRRKVPKRYLKAKHVASANLRLLSQVRYQVQNKVWLSEDQRGKGKGCVQEERGWKTAKWMDLLKRDSVGLSENPRWSGKELDIVDNGRPCPFRRINAYVVFV